MRQNDTGNNALGQATKSSGRSRQASKKLYFARNKDGAISKRHKANQAARSKRRAEYWASPAGKQRKFDKMTTPEKQKKQAAAKIARNNRRRERRLAEQQAKTVADQVSVQRIA